MLTIVSHPEKYNIGIIGKRYLQVGYKNNTTETMVIIVGILNLFFLNSNPIKPIKKTVPYEYLIMYARSRSVLDFWKPNIEKVFSNITVKLSEV